MAGIYSIDIKYDGTAEKIYVEKVKDGIFKCLKSCIFIDFITYGCEIEAEEVDSNLNYIGLLKESPFSVFRYVWSKEIIESTGCKMMQDEIMRIGGFWENAMGGIFIIHLPIEKADTLDNLLEMLKAQ